MRDPQEDAEQRHPGEHHECVPLQTTRFHGSRRSAKAATLFDIPTSEVYAVRIVPFAKKKLNIDAGVLHAGGYIDNALLNEVIGNSFKTGPTASGKVNLNIRARVAFAISYGF